MRYELVRKEEGLIEVRLTAMTPHEKALLALIEDIPDKPWYQEKDRWELSIGESNEVLLHGFFACLSPFIDAKTLFPIPKSEAPPDHE